METCQKTPKNLSFGKEWSKDILLKEMSCFAMDLMVNLSNVWDMKNSRL